MTTAQSTWTIPKPTSTLPTPSHQPPSHITPSRPSFVRRAVRPTVAGIALLVLASALVVAPEPRSVQASDVLAFMSVSTRGVVVAHRGDVTHGPENTMPALTAALNGSSHLIETDIQLTRDGVPVLFHDRWLHVKTDGEGRVSDHTLEELQALDAGAAHGPEFAGTRIPTLAEFLTALEASDKVALLELKGHWTPDEARIITDILDEHDVNKRVIMASFDPSTLLNVSAADPEAILIALRSTLPPDPVGYTLRHNAVALATRAASLEERPDVVSAMHRAGLRVMLYTLNSQAAWEKARDLRVDGVVTDRPDRLGQWMASERID